MSPRAFAPTVTASLVRLSKLLSLVLRHRPEKIGLALDEAGWVDVKTLLAALSRHGIALSRERLEEIITSGNKQRFALSADGLRIRALQGHSLPVALGYAPATPPRVLFHGTVARFLPGIRRHGLRRGRRHHVHLSATREEAARVGRRRGPPVILAVRSDAMADDGHAFYRAPNGVWLTDHVPLGYLEFPPSIA